MPTLLPGTVAVTHGSAAIVFSTAQAIPAGATIQFGSQPGAAYFIAATVSGTSGTLTASYSGTTNVATTATIYEQATFQHGGVVYPLSSSTAASSLHDADPALYYSLAYLTSVLQTYMGARLAAEAALAGLATGPNAVTQAVQYALPYEPKLVNTEQQIGKWPLLAVWRESGKYRWRTVARMETQATWRIAYMLPPMTGGQLERLQPMLNSVPKILLNRIEQRFDPFYAGGVSFMKLAGLDQVDMLEDAWGAYQFPQGAIVFPAWLGKLFVVERDENLPLAATGGALTGIDVDIQLAPPGQAVLDHFIDLPITT